MAIIGVGTTVNFLHFLMTYKHLSPNSKANKRAIAWALFSQSIWLPVFLSDAQDQQTIKSLNGHSSSVYGANTFINGHSEMASHLPLGKTSQPQKYSPYSGVVLSTTLSKGASLQSKIDSSNLNKVSNYSPIAFTSSARSSSIPIALRYTSISSEDKPKGHQAKQNIIPQPPELLQRLYTRSDLLGGAITLDDLNEPLMPAIARAERAQSSRTKDPLSTIPLGLREPMRKALMSLSNNFRSPSSPLTGQSSEVLTVDQARVIHIPSSRVKRFSEVPLALQADGTVDILNNPDDPEVVEEIKSWSSKQRLPEKGRMAPAVVHLHPLPQQGQLPIVSKKVSQPKSAELVDQSTAGQTAQEISPVVQDPSVRESPPPTPAAPPPPPPVIDLHTSHHQAVDSQSSIAEIQPAVPSVSASTGEVQ